MPSTSYRDECDAALAQAEALRTENHQLRAELDQLRSLLDPAVPKTPAGAIHGAFVATLVIVSATLGATLLARDALSQVDALQARSGPFLPDSVSIVEFEPQNVATTPMAPAVPLVPLVPEVPTVPAALLGPAMTERVAAVGLLLPVVPALRECLSGWRGTVRIDLGLDANGQLGRSEFRLRGHSATSLEDDARRCIVEAVEGVRPTTGALTDVTARYRVVSDAHGVSIRSVSVRHGGRVRGGSRLASTP